MHRLSIVALSLLVTTAIAAEVRNLGPLQPISVDRSGICAENSGLFWRHAGNGEAVLFLWHDDRHRSPNNGAPNTPGTMAIRLGPDGAPLDELPIYLPFQALAVVWLENDWVVLGEYRSARVSAEGELLDVRENPEFAFVHAAVWTGRVLIVVTQFHPPGSFSAVVFDEQLNHVATHDLPSVNDLIAAASDGTTSAMILTDSTLSLTGIRATVFGQDGQIRTSRVIHETATNRHDGAMVAVGEGRYAAVVSMLSRIDAMIVDTDLVKTTVGTLRDSTSPMTRDQGNWLFWDGSSVTAYTYYNTRTDRRELAVSHFTSEGVMPLPTEVLMASLRDSTRLDIAAAGSNLLFLRSDSEPPTLALHPFQKPDDLKKQFTMVKPSIERGVFPQEFASGASSRSQSLVSWIERGAPSVPPALYAARLDRDGKVLDPESLLLGSVYCDRRRPMVASNGSDFLTVWVSSNLGVPVLGVAATRSDGTVATNTVPIWKDAGCSAPMLLGSNGEDFLVVWPVRSGDRWSLQGARLRADGTTIDTTPIAVAFDFVLRSSDEELNLAVASDGRDYLVAFEQNATRVTGQGVALDRFVPISLAKDVNQAWWNGVAYVINNAGGFFRVGTDGKIGGPLGVASPSVADGVLRSSTNGFICGPGGCTTVRASLQNGSSMVIGVDRWEDDGTNVTPRYTRVTNFVYPFPWATQYLGGFAVDAGRLVSILTFTRTDSPYNGVQRLYVAPFVTPRVRAVQH